MTSVLAQNGNTVQRRSLRIPNSKRSLVSPLSLIRIRESHWLRLAIRGAQYARAFLTNQQIYSSHGNMTPSETVSGSSGNFQTLENRLFLWCIKYV